MTNEMLDTAKKVAQEVSSLTDIVNFLNSNIENWERRTKSAPHWWKQQISFKNIFKNHADLDNNKPTSVVYIDLDKFADGLTIDASPELIKVIRDYFKTKLDEKVKEFKEIG